MFAFSQVLINQLTDNGKTEFAAGGKYETSNNISPSALLKKKNADFIFYSSYWELPKVVLI